MKFMVALCRAALTLGSTQLLANGDEERHAGHGNSFGKAGDAAKVARTVEVDMSDVMRFTPASIEVGKGETIRFVVKNSGQLKHGWCSERQRSCASTPSS